MNVSGRYFEIFQKNGYKDSKTKGKSGIVNPLSLQEGVERHYLSNSKFRL